MTFQRVCALSELPTVGAIRVVLDDMDAPLAVVRDDEGTVHAIEDECSHGSVALSEGEVDGNCIECWLHGARFDLRTGAPLTPPATAAILVYPVHIDGDDVLVDIPATPHA
ncbi:Biphenyl dioxygenase ferredoxin subunit [Austwickia sp. TVS 96-490-7B]|uniref:non-heme iron oxygenase ferredoxin subunit n=1 Tax=Austwickia sp. TVS 96-490-7B TaxID=2830843 RepID=UPI001C57B1FB|nr:non-heme iron oxygenase ferredoxin subunit [Austwickia sp. TVS 96-490-7B]MBW3085422.1 Biphenyl dioxygenase ferredoxin subunit [Austwickia sp. TVS 96-490-7B]